MVTADGRAVIECTAISAYLLKTYDTEGRFAAQDWIRDEELSSFAGASMGSTNTLELTIEIAVNRTPWPIVYIMRGFRKGLQKGFTVVEIRKNLAYLESELGDAEWFNGAQLGRSDVMLQWPVDTIASRGWIDLAKEYPKLDAWRKRIFDRPAWKRGLEKGNGYDLTEFA